MHAGHEGEAHGGCLGAGRIAGKRPGDGVKCRHREGTQMNYPQIVGLKCSRCNKIIDSIVDGRFCPSCCNPIHAICIPLAGTAVADGRCPQCGSDPQSPQAQEIKAEIQERRVRGPRVICPNCGSTQGFTPLRTEPSLLFGLAGYFLTWIIRAGELRCEKCQNVFRPHSGVLVIGCIIVFILALVGIVALTAIRR
jgi:hypothetical protein